MDLINKAHNNLTKKLISKLTSKILERTLRSGGSTTDIYAMKVKEGIAFAPSKISELKIPLKQFNKDAILQYIRRNFGEIKKGDKIGTWLNPVDGNVYLDITRVLPETKAMEAVSKAKAGDQLSIYNIGKKNYQSLDSRPLEKIAEEVVQLGESINLPNTGKYAKEIGNVDKIEVYATGTNKFIDAQRKIVEELTPEQVTRYLKFKKKSGEVYEYYKDKVMEFQNEKGVKVSDPKFMRKSDGRTVEKMFKDIPEGQKDNMIWDMNRGSIETNNFNKYPEYIKRVVNDIFNGNVIRIKNFIKTPTRDGYRAVIINGYLPNGTIAEFQIIPKGIGDVKLKAHGIYEITRATPLTASELHLLVGKQREIFNKAWENIDKSEYLRYKDVIDNL